MQSNIRPETMERITTLALANAFIDEQIAEIRAQVGDKKVLLALSGGVDSSVVAALLIKAIGKQLVCVHVNHGLMRKDESEGVIKMFKDGMDANLIYVDATDHFLGLLAGVSEPERKRKIIGKEFIMVLGSVIMLNIGLRPGAAEIYGKVATLAFYVVMVFIIGFGPEVGAFRNLFTIPNTLMMILVIISAILTMVAFFSYIPDVIRQVKEKKNKAK